MINCYQISVASLWMSDIPSYEDPYKQITTASIIELN